MSQTPRIRLSQEEFVAVQKARQSGAKLDSLLAGTGPSTTEDRIHSDGMKREIKMVSDIRTVEDVLAHAEVDTAIWRVKDFTCKKWEMGYKDKNDVAQREGLFAVAVKLERREKPSLTDALEALHARALEHKPVSYFETPTYPRGDGVLVEMALYDAHFGKLAWKPEGYSDYDLRIAEGMYANAGDDLLRDILPFEIDRFVIPIGNDFLHVDNSHLTTEAGTEQGAQTEGRYAKIVETGFMALVKFIDKMRLVAPVDCLFVKGNHDPTSTYHLMRELKAWYRGTKDVDVDVCPRDRKYYEWKSTLLGFTHGNKEPISRLMNLMPQEVPERWARTKTREWHVGHTHKRAQLVTKGVETYEGLTVRTMPSLSATDAWHYGKGYIGTRAADALIYDADGFRGMFAANARFTEE